MEKTIKLLFLFLGVFSVGCFPSRPLNDRPSELTWQAWLLVDSQNQLQNESDRRITPKSVFIAPKLGQRNDTLPDCADGYRADSMGRCIKFVKVDETAHLNFLLSRLNEMYAQNSDEDFSEESEENIPTAGPLQVNIPLGQTEDNTDNSEESIKIDSGIEILAPSNGQFEETPNVKRHPEHKEKTNPKQKQPETLTKIEENPEDYDYFEDNTEKMETTTQFDEITTEMTEDTTPFDSTTIIPMEETTGITTDAITTDKNLQNDDLKALFFLMPNKTKLEFLTKPNQFKEVHPDDVEQHGTHRPVIINYQNPLLGMVPPKQQTSDFQNPTDIENNTPRPQPVFQEPPDPETVPVLTFKERITFPKEERPQHAHRPEEEIRLPTIKFPQDSSEEHHEKNKNPSILITPHLPQYQSDFPANIKPHYGPQHTHRPSSNLSPAQVQEMFKQYLQRHVSYPERPQLPHSNVYNHRNRDRTPTEELWRHSSTPKVEESKPSLSFSNYPQNYYPQSYQKNNQEYFGGSPQEFSQSYGRKRRRGNLR